MRIINATLALVVLGLAAAVIVDANATVDYTSGYPSTLSSVQYGIPPTYGEGFTYFVDGYAPTMAQARGELHALVEGENRSGGAVVWERTEVRGEITGATTPRWEVSTTIDSMEVLVQVIGQHYQNPDSTYWARAYRKLYIWGQDSPGNFTGHTKEAKAEFMQESPLQVIDGDYSYTTPTWEYFGAEVRFGFQVTAEGGINTGRQEFDVLSDVSSQMMVGWARSYDGSNEVYNAGGGHGLPFW
jgi:hypothetical protein